MKKFFLFLTIVLLTISLSLILTLHFLPPKIKSSLEENAQRWGQRLTIERVYLHPLKGLILEELYLRPEKEAYFYLQIKKARISFFLPSLLFRTKIITLCELKDINCLWTKTDKPLNLTSLPKPAHPQNPAGVPPLLVKNWRIRNLSLTFRDETANFKKSFSSLILDLNWALRDRFNFKLRWEDYLYVKGDYSLDKEELNAKVLLKNIDLKEFQPYLKNINLENATIKKANLTLKGVRDFSLKGLCLLERINLSYPLAIFSQEDIIHLKGKVIFEEIDFSFKEKLILNRILGKLKAEVSLSDWLFLKDTQASFKVEGNHLEVNLLNANLNQSNLRAKIKLHDFNQPQIRAKARLKGGLEQILLNFKRWIPGGLGWTAKGEADLHLLCEIRPQLKIFDYRLDFFLKNAQVWELQNLYAFGKLRNEELLIEKASLTYKDVPFNLNASLKHPFALISQNSFYEPRLKLEAKANTSLKEAIEVIREFKEINFPEIEKGNLNLSFSLEGNPLKKEFNYRLAYEILQAEIRDFKEIFLKGEVTNDLLKVEELNLLYKDIPFKGSGYLENFPSPSLKLSLESQLLNLYGKAYKEKGYWKIKEVFLTAPQSKAVAHGQINKEQLDLEGFGTISFSDALRVLPYLTKYPVFLDKLKPEGLLDTTFIIRGKPNLKDCEIKLDAYAQNLKVYNVEAKDTKFYLYKDKERLTLSPLVSQVAEGLLELRSELELTKEKGVLNLILNDLDLDSLREQLNLKHKRLKGKLSLDLGLKTESLKNLDALSGSGGVSIKDGNLWEINFLKGLGEFLFIPDFEEIRFRNGRSDLYFKGKEIIFENLALNSFQMDLEGGGKIDWNGNIHFMLFPRFNPKLLMVSEGLKKITTQIIGKSGLLIEIEGTLKEPIYKKKLMLLSPQILEDIKNFFRSILE